MGGGRIGLAVAAAGTVLAASEAAVKAEVQVLNVPLSMLLVAIAGTMIGFVILKPKDAARLSFHGKNWRERLGYGVLTIIPLILAVLGYAFVAAWAVQLGASLVHTLTRLIVEQSALIPATGLAGVGIRFWLPSLLQAVERRATKVIGGDA